MTLARLLAGADGFVARNERSYLHAFMDELGLAGESDMSADDPADIETWLMGIKDEHVKRVFGFSDEVFQRFEDWARRMDQLRTEGVKLILDPNRPLN